MDCDAVVIGAGSNGLTLAAYLQRAGLSTVVVEQAPAVGGQCRTESPVRPGFLFHPHATFLHYTAVWPMAADLDLDRRLRVVRPEVQHGIAFADGRPGIVMHSLDHLDRTRTSIARYSAADADLFVELQRRARRLTSSIARTMYAAPSSSRAAGHLAEVESAYSGLGVTARLGTRTVQDLVDDLFVSPELRTLLYLLSAEFGVDPTERGGDAAFLGTVLWLIGGRSLPMGGMHTVTDALAAAATSAGVRILTETGVRTVTVDSGRASGVRLADGRTIAARRLVASSAGLADTLLRLVATGVPPVAEAQARSYHRSARTVMTAQQFCLSEPPDYRSARHEPDLNRATHVLIGYDTPDAVLDQRAAVDAGQLPSPAGSVHITSQHDPGQAPAGYAAAGVNTLFPAANRLGTDEQAAIRRSYPEAFRQRWLAYAPNLTEAKVVGTHFGWFSTADRQVLLKTGHDQYRGPVRGLYLCGAAQYPGGGVHGACGYNAFAAIAADLGLPAPRAMTTPTTYAAAGG